MDPNTVYSFNQKQQEKYAARTGIIVDIQNIGKNTQLIAIPEKKSIEQIRQGVWLRKNVIEFADGNFSNEYDLLWNPKQTDIIPLVSSSKNTPYSLHDQVKNDRSIVAIINGAFFFLADEADRQPIDLPYNLCIRDGKIVGIPSYDQPIVYIQGGKLSTREPKACGIISIDGQQVQWVGAHSQQRKKDTIKAVLYNSKCSDVIKVRDYNTGVQIGILDNDHITTPKNPTVFDIVVNEDALGRLTVSHINKGGGTHFFDGLFILQMHGEPKNVQKGSTVIPLTLDGMELRTISSAMTIGRRIDDPFFLDPSRIDKRDSRSIIAQDIKGNIHFIAFDGSKYVPGFNGVSAKDIASILNPNRFSWAYFLDGGGSSRIIVRDGHKLRFFANEFSFTKINDGELFLWDPTFGRKLASSISLRIVNQ